MSHLRNGIRFNNVHVNIISAISSIRSDIFQACPFLKAQSAYLFWKWKLLRIFRFNLKLERVATSFVLFGNHLVLDGSKLILIALLGAILQMLLVVPFFRDSRATFVGCFSHNCGSHNALYAEFLAIIMSLEHAKQEGYMKVWIEASAQVSIAAFNNTTVVP